MEWLPPPPPHGSDGDRHSLNPTNRGIGWERVEAKLGSMLPVQRSLHAGAVWRDFFIIFGGYDGHHRVNDLYSFNFKTNFWQLLSNNNAPSPRDRHVAVVFENSLYVFGGFDGLARVNDMHSYDLELNEWRSVVIAAGAPPSPRHSHAAVIYHESMFVFGGYDGSYRNDFHEFDFSQRIWHPVQPGGDIPRARYRGTCVVSGDAMILHGGHDGSRHLQDTHVFDFINLTWSSLLTEGPTPSPRDSHIAVIYKKSMFLYGGSTGSAMGDFHELKLEFRRVWSPVYPGSSNNNNLRSGATGGGGHGGGVIGGGGGGRMMRIGGAHSASSSPFTGSSRGGHTAFSRSHSNNGFDDANSNTPAQPRSGGHDRDLARAGADTRGARGGSGDGGGAPEQVSPGVRFCHVGVVHDSCLYIFGGYDGSQRLNDFLRYRFEQNEPEISASPSTLVSTYVPMPIKPSCLLNPMLINTMIVSTYVPIRFKELHTHSWMVPSVVHTIAPDKEKSLSYNFLVDCAYFASMPSILAASYIIRHFKELCFALDIHFIY